MIEFTEENFQAEVLDSDIPVLVDYWSQYCQPCLMLTPVVEALAAEYEGKAKVGKLNAVENPGIATAQQVQGLPTLVIYKNGQQVDRQMGMFPKDFIANMIDKQLDTAAT
jgi:thioredoxin 1